MEAKALSFVLHTAGSKQHQQPTRRVCTYVVGRREWTRLVIFRSICRNLTPTPHHPMRGINYVCKFKDIPPTLSQPVHRIDHATLKTCPHHQQNTYFALFTVGGAHLNAGPYVRLEPRKVRAPVLVIVPPCLASNNKVFCQKNYAGSPRGQKCRLDFMVFWFARCQKARFALRWSSWSGIDLRTVFDLKLGGVWLTRRRAISNIPPATCNNRHLPSVGFRARPKSLFGALTKAPFKKNSNNSNSIRISINKGSSNMPGTAGLTLSY